MMIDHESEEGNPDLFLRYAKGDLTIDLLRPRTIRRYLIYYISVF